MKLQRYPDGANAWTLFVWSRHPGWSLTWTHSMAITRRRQESGQSRFGVFRIRGGQSFCCIVLFGIELNFATQKAMRK